MCGRYTLIEPDLESILEIDAPVVDDRPQNSSWTARYNIAPMQEVPIFALEKDEQMHLGFQHWDLIPSYTKDLKTKFKMINLKAENITDLKKPYWNRLLQRKRCLIPTDGFYEWQVVPGEKNKRPYFISLTQKRSFTLAGVWDQWTSPEGKEVHSFAIITCPANDLVARIHNDKKRMPVILDGEQQKRWCDPKLSDLSAMSQLLKPYPEEKMEAYEISTLVNNARNDSPDCVASVNIR